MKKTDVFISYKHHTEDGNVSRDYAIAKELYEGLTKAGISTFFSDATIFELGISDYKKAIEFLDKGKKVIDISYDPDTWNLIGEELTYKNFDEKNPFSYKSLCSIIFPIKRY